MASLLQRLWYLQDSQPWSSSLVVGGHPVSASEAFTVPSQVYLGYMLAIGAWASGRILCSHSCLAWEAQFVGTHSFQAQGVAGPSLSGLQLHEVCQVHPDRQAEAVNVSEQNSHNQGKL